VWHAPVFLIGYGGQQSIPLPAAVAAAFSSASLVSMSAG
jgi:hypothetical protein